MVLTQISKDITLELVTELKLCQETQNNKYKMFVQMSHVFTPSKIKSTVLSVSEL